MKTLAAIQGVYFLLTGVWPILSIRTFEAVTGAKTDKWLVKTVGALITMIGAAILLAAWRDNVTAEIILLAVGSAVALAIVDFWYVVRGVIAKIYLADGAAEVLLIIAWGITLLVEHRP